METDVDGEVRQDQSQRNSEERTVKNQLYPEGHRVTDEAAKG